MRRYVVVVRGLPYLAATSMRDAVWLALAGDRDLTALLDADLPDSELETLRATYPYRREARRALRDAAELVGLWGEYENLIIRMTEEEHGYAEAFTG